VRTFVVGMLKKVILWLVVVFLLLSGGIIAYVYHNQEILKDRLILSVNERLKVPVEVKDITISPLSSFPDATVKFFNVRINDPHFSDSLFAEAGEIGFSFNIWDLIRGKMVLEEIIIVNGSVNITQYDEDRWSYQIYNEVENKTNDSFFLNIEKVNVKNIHATYGSAISETAWSGIIKSSQASVKLQGPVTWINTTAEISSEVLKIRDFKTLQDQLITAEAEMVLDKHWRITTSLLNIGDSFFELDINKNDELIAASLKATNANVQTLLSLTPIQLKERLRNYKSTGNISLKSQIHYVLSSGKTSMDGNLIFNRVSIIQKEPEINLQGLNFTGNVKIPDFKDLSTASIILTGINGKMNNKPLKGDFSLKNYNKPYIKASYTGEMPLAFINDLGGLEINNPSGLLNINLFMEGDFAAFSDPEAIREIKTSGEVSFKNIRFFLPNRSYAYEAPDGTAIFNNNHLAINNLELVFGQSNFKINGQLRNFWNISSGKKWSAVADVHSKSLMLDELLSVENPNPSAEIYSYHIPSNISLELNATVDDFKVRKFKAAKVSGKITVKDKMLQADNLSLEAMGGMVKLKGRWQDLQKIGSDIDISFVLAGINADSLFYSFESFNQDFITEKNISGEIYAESEASLRLDSNLIFLPNSLNVTLNTKIINGELKDFQPLYSLEKYFNDADLSKVKFAELENRINIKNQTIHLPMMPVGTNIIKFKIGGIHTFDQHINYKVVAPLNRKQKVDKDERYGQVAEDQHGESLLFLSIAGTTEKFEVSLDKKALKQEIASDVKKEVKELQDAFKNNGKTKAEEVELKDDDYFDWDE
jgi:hypothetical protein